MNSIQAKRTLLQRLLCPSMPLRMAYYFVAWVAIIVILGLGFSDPGCTGEGMRLQ